MKKIPTGIESLDPIIKGGFPPGSFVILLGEEGSGHVEFAYTSAFKLAEGGRFKNGDTVIPEKICYISITKSREDILNEIQNAFSDVHYQSLQKRLEFKDFSWMYFMKSPVPAAWVTESKVSFEQLKSNETEKNLIDSLVHYMDETASSSVVIIDSLTALAQYCSDTMKWRDMISFLRGLQKVSKRWNGLVYAILNNGVFENGKQEEIMECADGVLMFGWENMGTSLRQRSMYVKKFRGLLPQLEADNIVKFETAITPQVGYEVSYIKRVRGK
ncbi:MAG TPA: AAA family ATPase [Candidatus Methanoperedenaceae archaeon]|nr:AAA family ATPase [Candidatus Methanoperedenaceae archaeon]